MTEQQTLQINDLRQKYETALAKYQEEEGDQYIFRQRWITASNQGGLVDGGTAEHWDMMRKASLESLAVKKSIMDSAYKAWNDLKDYIAAADLAAFQAANPQIAVQLAEQEAKAQAEIKALELKAQNEKELNQTKANYAASNTKYYIIAGITFFVMIIIAGVSYFRTKQPS